MLRKQYINFIVIKYNGFTVIEVVFTIVVIGILVTVFVNLFPSANTSSRDTERETDMNSLAALLESYYNSHGTYPLIANVTPSTVTGVTDDMLKTPGASGSSLASTTTPTKDQYGYVTYMPDMTPCTSGTGCGSKFLLSWYNETQQTVLSKGSVH